MHCFLDWQLSSPLWLIKLNCKYLKFYIHKVIFFNKYINIFLKYYGDFLKKYIKILICLLFGILQFHEFFYLFEIFNLTAWGHLLLVKILCLTKHFMNRTKFRTKYYSPFALGIVSIC